MKLAASPFVVRVWMPMMLILGVCLFFRGAAPEYWLVALPLVLVAVFMSTLAEIQNEGRQIQVRTLWHSTEIPKEDVASIAQSSLEGIGVLRLRRFVLPWGRIYFVSDWSKLGVSLGHEKECTDAEPRPYSSARVSFESLAVAISGFLAARAMRTGAHDFGLETPAMRIGMFAIAGILCVVFAIARTRRPSFANVTLFVATFMVGLAHW
jgi:hypothetical protein